MFKRNEKGITLIALVITIIVLLILAGVSIAMLTGGNGLLSKSVQARKDSYRGEICDKINTALDACYAEILSEKYGAGEFPTDTSIKQDNGMSTAPEHGSWEVTADKSAPEGVYVTITWKAAEGYGRDISGTINKGEEDLPYTVSAKIGETSSSSTPGD